MLPLLMKELVHGTAVYQDSVKLRDKILRKPLGMQFTEEQLMEETEQIHLSAWHKNKLVACLILVPLEERKVKMRQVAVDDSYQRKGVGSALLQYAENYARHSNYKTLFCHARDTAKDFYLKHQYRIEGLRFQEIGIDHYRMVKDL